MKKLIAMIVVILLFGMLATPALADSVGEKCITLGADLTDEQRVLVLQSFGIKDGDTIKELTVSNDEERLYLKGLVPDEKIGRKALSSIYIEILESGAGMTITTNNINWCTTQMYKNALTTAGITDAKVIVSAPFPVSGTAGLTGAYKAYESITGITLSDIAKSVGVEELIVTGELAEYIGSDEAALLINELKKILDQTQNMTDDQVRSEIRAIADAYNVALTDAQVEQLLKLCRSLEKLDVTALKDRLVQLTKTVESAQKAGTFFSNLGQGIKTFFASVGNFFSKLFGKK